MAGLRNLEKVKIAVPGSPVGGFILSFDDALEIDSPNLVLGAGEAKNLERNGDLGGPAGFSDGGGNGPILVPLGENPEGLIADQGVEARSTRIHAEQECVAMVMIAVQDDGEAVVARQLIVPPQLAGANQRGLAVQEFHANVQESFVVENPDTRGFGGGS